MGTRTSCHPEERSDEGSVRAAKRQPDRVGIGMGFRRQHCRGLDLHGLALFGVTAATLSFAQDARQPDKEGKLILYDFMTEIGVVAMREFRDEHNRPSRRIMYTPRWDSQPTTQPSQPTRFSFRGPFDPDNLAVHAVETYDYDRDGRKVRTSGYGPDGALGGFSTYRYHDQGWLRQQIAFTPDGRRYYEIRYDPPRPDGQRRWEASGPPGRGPSVSHLYFDESGTGLVAVRGRIPEDLPWTWGWGPERDGLSCAVAPYRASGPPDKVRLGFSVLNVTRKDRQVGGGPGSYRPVLSDADGQIVPISESSRGARFLLTTAQGGMLVRAGEAYNAGSFDLAWWYANLSPGRYTLQVEYRGSGTEWLLTTNSVTITIDRAAP